MLQLLCNTRNLDDLSRTSTKITIEIIIVRNPISYPRLRRHNAIYHLAFQHACHISTRPLFIFVERRVDDAICKAKLSIFQLTYSAQVHWTRPFQRNIWACIDIPRKREPPSRGSLRASNLFLCIFLLFAVRIVASLGAVCMRTGKNYVRAPEDPL